MHPKILTLANGVNGGVYSMASEWEWGCLLTKLEAHCLQHVNTKKRYHSFASLPDGGIFTIVARPMECISFPIKNCTTQLIPPPVYLDDHSTLFGEETGSLQSTLRTKTLQYLDMPFDFYRKCWDQDKEGARDDMWKGYIVSDHNKIAEVCSQLAQDFLVHGNNIEAMKMYRKSLSIQLTFLGKNHQSVSKTYNNIGTVYWMQGKHEEARRIHELAFTTRLDAIEERYSEGRETINATERCDKAKGGQGVKSYNSVVPSSALHTFQTRTPADVVATKVVPSNDTFTKDSSEQSNCSPSPSTQPQNESESPMNDDTTRARPPHSRMNNLASTTLRENCKFHRPAFSYLIQ